uniref:Uncharacterized protein n=1 Tax=Romanomermis culicivorax TaxID=13658 RepID=A0A915KAE8_ROMCU
MPRTHHHHYNNNFRTIHVVPLAQYDKWGLVERQAVGQVGPRLGTGVGKQGWRWAKYKKDNNKYHPECLMTIDKILEQFGEIPVDPNLEERETESIDAIVKESRLTVVENEPNNKSLLSLVIDNKAFFCCWQGLMMTIR